MNNKEEYFNKQLKKREGAFKKIFSLFHQQKKAVELFGANDNVKEYPVYSKGDNTLNKQYVDYVYGTYLTQLSQEKRIREYFTMAADPELQYALTEIVDEIVTDDDQGKLFQLKMSVDTKENVKNILIEEFTQLIVNRLRLSEYNKLWDWVYKWIVQGILVFKINFHYEKNNGIESLEELKPWLVSELKKEGDRAYYVVKENSDDDKGLKYDSTEILKIDCGFSYDEQYFSILEFVKKDWRRLNLIEDATVIYKLSRSPMRRVFKVYVGKMAPKDIEGYLQDFRLRLREDVRYDSESGEVIGLNPITMLDDYFFPVMEGGQESCSVDVLQERDTGFNTQDELKYFLGKVYRSMKIPAGRMNLVNENGDYSTTFVGSKAGSITRDEIKFSNYIKRFQNRFLEQFIQELFYLHLFHRGLIDRLNITKKEVEVQFLYKNPYAELKNAEIEEYRMQAFNNMAGQNELISTEFCLKKYLKWSDEEIKDNYTILKREMKLKAQVTNLLNGEGAMGGNMDMGGMGGMGGDLGMGGVGGSTMDEMATQSPEGANLQANEPLANNSSGGNMGGAELTETPPTGVV